MDWNFAKSLAGFQRWLLFAGIVIMTISGQRLGFRIGVMWEFAGFACGILLIMAGWFLPLVKKIDELERKVSDLASPKRD
jgi:hypothetical protein